MIGRLKWSAAVAAAVVIGVVLAMVLRGQAETDDRLDALGSAVTAANDRLRDAGLPTVPVPSSTGATGATGKSGAVGPQGPPPSAAQVAAAVSTYCAVN